METVIRVNQVKKIIFLVGLCVGLLDTEAEDLLTACPGALEQPIELSESCMARLDDHFLEQAVWKVAKMTYQVFERQWSHWSDYNNRVKYLVYSPSDLHVAPVWSDVLDGQIYTRNQAVMQSFNDAECNGLDADVAIRADLAYRCNGDALIKYALYIDACITSFVRVDNLSTPSVVNNETGKVETTFAHSLGVIETTAGRKRLIDSYLHSAWLLERCELMPITPMGYHGGELDSSRMTLVELIDLFRDSHDRALKIAAKTGNAWAQLMYIPIDLAPDSVYMRSLHEHNPLLAHRWMARYLTYEVLSVQDRIHHAVKARELESDGSSLFEYLDHQFKFHSSDVEHFKATLVEGMVVELKYPWSVRE